MSHQADLGLPDHVEIFPPDWPGDRKPGASLPGDISKFAVNHGPQNTRSQFHPFRFDSKLHPGGGLIYFDEYIEFGELKATLRLMGVTEEMTDYAVFAGSSKTGTQVDYLDQLRFVSHHALESGYFISNQNLRPRAISL
jgi:hypothetical protein